MKLLSILVVLLVIHFYRMDLNSKCNCKDLLSEDWNSTAYKSSCSRGLAAQIANASAEEARAANEAQAAAGQNAAQQVKLLLAHRALAAASAARFLVQGKQAVVARLAKKIQEAEAVVDQIKASLETSQANVEATRAVRKMMDKHNATMLVVMDQMRSSLEDLDTLIDLSEAELEKQNEMLAKAKKLDDQLSREVAKAKAEYEVAKVATCRAQSAALAAQQKSCSPTNATASPGNSSSCDQ